MQEDPPRELLADDSELRRLLRDPPVMIKDGSLVIESDTELTKYPPSATTGDKWKYAHPRMNDNIRRVTVHRIITKPDGSRRLKKVFDNDFLDPKTCVVSIYWREDEGEEII